MGGLVMDTDFFKPSSDEVYPARRQVGMGRIKPTEVKSYSSDPNWIYGERVIIPPYEERKSIGGYEEAYQPGRDQDEVVVEGSVVNDQTPGYGSSRGWRYDFEGEEPERFEGRSWEELSSQYERQGLSREEAEQDRRARELEELSMDLERAKREAALRKLKESKFQKFERGAQRTAKVAGVAYKAATLGGAIKPQRMDLYQPKSMKGLTDPGSLKGSRKLTSMQTLREGRESMVGAPLKSQSQVGLQGLRELSRPRVSSKPMGDGLEKLRSPQGVSPRGGQLPVGSSPIAQLSLAAGNRPVASTAPIAIKATDISRSEDTYSMLRGLTMPSGLSPVEQEVYKMIQTTPGADTSSSVIGTLAVGSVSRGEVGGAITSLVRRGVLRQDRSYPGEPMLEVTR